MTQNILGAAAAQAVFSRSLGRKAALLGAAGGAVPDFDFLLKSFADPAFPHEFHRHFTHAIVFIPIGGVIATLPFLVIPSIRRQWKTALLAAIVGCATHALLDCCTSYGTMWYWPFTSQRIGWDLISIIDPLFTLPLILAVIFSLRKRTATAAFLGLLWSVLYMGVGYVQRERARSTQAELAHARGHDIVRSRVFPTFGNLLFWRSVYESNGMLWADEIMLNSPIGAQVDEGESIPLLTFNELSPSVRDSERIADVFWKLNDFADGYVAAFPNRYSGEGPVFIGDMRYSRTARRFAPIWGIYIDTSNAIEPVTWRGWTTSTAETIEPHTPSLKP